MSKGVISWFVKGLSKLSLLAKLLLAKKRPKLVIQLPNAGDDNQSCRILTVLLIESIRNGFRLCTENTKTGTPSEKIAF